MDDGVQGSSFSEYCCIPLQPSLPYVNQSKAHFTSIVYQDKHSCEHYGHMTEEYYRPVCWGSLTT